MKIGFGIQVIFPRFVYDSHISLLRCCYVRQDLVEFPFFKIFAITIFDTKRELIFFHNFLSKSHPDTALLVLSRPFKIPFDRSLMTR